MSRQIRWVACNYRHLRVSRDLIARNRKIATILRKYTIWLGSMIPLTKSVSRVFMDNPFNISAGVPSTMAATRLMKEKNSNTAVPKTAATI